MARRGLGRAIALVLVVVAPLGSTGCGPSPEPSAGMPLPAFSHVGIVVFENKSYAGLFGFGGRREAPYLNDLAARSASATHYYGIGHGSLTNYIALVSGQPPVASTQNDCPLYDCLYPASVPTLADQLESSGRTWKAYLDGMPATCVHGREGEPDPYRVYVPGGNSYATRHNPFLYFRSIVDDPPRCDAHDVPYTELASDLAHGALPDFFLIVPDLCHDAHSCPLAEADAWAAQELPRLITHPDFVDDGVLFVTFDESEGDDTGGCCGDSGGGHTALIVVSPKWVRSGEFSTPHNHYALLRTIEEAWGLPTLGHAQDPGISPLRECFLSTPR